MKRLFAGLCALSVVLTACGGSDKKSDTAATTATTAASTTSSEATTTTAAPETTTTAAAAASAGAAGAAPGHDGKVGDKLVTAGFQDNMEMMAIKVTEVIDPADAIMTAAHYKTDADKRFVIIKSEFTNLGPKPYETGSEPDIGFVLVDDRNQEYPHSIAIVDSCPGYPHAPLATNASASGCTFFELAKATPLVAVRWAPREDFKDRTLTWKK